MDSLDGGWNLVFAKLQRVPRSAVTVIVKLNEENVAVVRITTAGCSTAERGRNMVTSQREGGAALCIGGDNIARG